jgi:hypothetical protein
MWNEAVSRAHRARKKMYCSNIGCEARKLEGSASPRSVVVPFVAETLVLALLVAEVESDSDVDGIDGVAFSIRAHVK